MRRFALKENLALYRKLLAEETRESRRQTLRSLLCSAQRELALVESSFPYIGVCSGLSAPGNRDGYRISRFQSDSLSALTWFSILVLACISLISTMLMPQ